MTHIPPLLTIQDILRKTEGYRRRFEDIKKKAPGKSFSMFITICLEYSREDRYDVSYCQQVIVCKTRVTKSIYQDLSINPRTQDIYIRIAATPESFITPDGLQEALDAQNSIVVEFNAKQALLHVDQLKAEIKERKRRHNRFFSDRRRIMLWQQGEEYIPSVRRA